MAAVLLLPSAARLDASMTLLPLFCKFSKLSSYGLASKRLWLWALWVKCVALLGVFLLIGQSQADLLRILHDALVGIVEGLDELLVGTTGGVMDERVPIELELLEDLGTIMQ